MENISVFLWSTLSRFIGTEEQVLLRRRYYELMDDICKIADADEIFSYILSGSRAEGLDLEGSDIDIMLVCNSIPLIDRRGNPTEIRNDSARSAADLQIDIDTSNIKAGFVRLRYSGDLTEMQDVLVQTKDGIFLSSLLFRDKCIESLSEGDNSDIDDAVGHGPCVMFKLPQPINIEIDVLPCFSCTTWPALADDWLKRVRTNDWPSRELIIEIVKEGCLFVPIGNPNSQETFFQWRISFSLAVKKLVHSFNHTQFLCYAFLKLYLKHVINMKIEVKDLLCSYFLKTCLFYCIEDEHVTWTKENFLNCFWVCLRRLIKWVRDEYCPNYFIKENNMFEGKVCGEKGKVLLKHLTNLYHDGIQRLHFIPCLSVLNIFPTDKDMQARSLPSATICNLEMEYLCDMFMFKMPLNLPRWHLNITDCIVATATLIERSKCRIDRLLLKIFLSFSVHQLVQDLFQNIITTGSNKCCYKQLIGLKTFIIQNAMDIDVYTGMLLLATLCYLTEEYEQVMSIVMRLLEKFKSCMIYFGSENTKSDKEAYIRRICGKGLTIYEKMSIGLWARSYICDVDCGFYPPEIKSELELAEGTDRDGQHIPPLVYSYVLFFLSSFHMKSKTKMDYALTELYFAMHDRRYVDELEKPLAKSLVLKCHKISERWWQN